MECRLCLKELPKNKHPYGMHEHCKKWIQRNFPKIAADDILGPNTSKPFVRKTFKCRIDGCIELHYAKGYCYSHYFKFAITKKLVVCNQCKERKQHNARGLCNNCYQKNWRKGYLPEGCYKEVWRIGRIEYENLFTLIDFSQQNNGITFKDWRLLLHKYSLKTASTYWLRTINNLIKFRIPFVDEVQYGKSMRKIKVSIDYPIEVLRKKIVKRKLIK